MAASVIQLIEAVFYWRIAMTKLVRFKLILLLVACFSLQHGQVYAQEGGPNLPTPNLLPALGQPTVNGPIVVPPISFVDINNGKFGKLEIDLLKAEFMDTSCDSLHLVARDMDLREGHLSSLDIDMRNAKFQDFNIDRLDLSTKGSLFFDTGVLFNHRMLQFMNPAQAQVTAIISQKSLNQFLAAPRVQTRLAVTAQKKLSIINNFLGPNAGLGLTVSNAKVNLLGGNRMLVDVNSKVGLGQYALPLNFSLNSHLGLANGWVHLDDTKVLTSGQELSPELSKLFVERINNLANWGRSSDDIHFVFSDIQVKTQDSFILKGIAHINRLRFGRVAEAMKNF
jgi:hypothetical protein